MYRSHASELQRPCIFTASCETPRTSNSVVPPIWKEWPLRSPSPDSLQMWAHRLSIVSRVSGVQPEDERDWYAKSGAEIGSELDTSRCHKSALVAETSVASGSQLDRWRLAPTDLVVLVQGNCMSM